MPKDNKGLKLLPCPFCGGEAEIKKHYEARVYCKNPSCFMSYDGPMMYEEKSVKAWNTRADERKSDG